MMVVDADKPGLSLQRSSDCRMGPLLWEDGSYSNVAAEL